MSEKQLVQITLVMKDFDSGDVTHHTINTTREVDFSASFDLIPETGREMYIIKLEQYSPQASMLRALNGLRI